MRFGSCHESLALLGSAADGRILGHGSRMVRAQSRVWMLDGQLDSEGCACARRGVHGNFSAMIAHDRLDDCEAEAGAMLLARVIRCEEARALFRCQARSSIGGVEAHRTIM